MAAVPMQQKAAFSRNLNNANYEVVQETLAATGQTEWRQFLDGVDVYVSGGATMAAAIQRAYLDDKSDVITVPSTAMAHDGSRGASASGKCPAWYRVNVTTLTTSDAVITMAGRVD